MNIYVVRHGQTYANANGIIAGTTDVDINEIGVIQAKEAGKIMSTKDYDIVFCSPLIRTRHTCDYVNTKNKEVIIDDRLIERCAGIYEGKVSDKNDPNGLKLNEYWDYTKKIEYEGAESLDSMFERVNSFLTMLKDNNQDKNILIVTHCGVCRTIRCLIDGMPYDGNLRTYTQDNCQIAEYKVD